MNKINFEKNEFCTNCRGVQNIKGTTTETEKKVADKIKKIITVNFHCEKCNTFIRSEKFEEKHHQETIKCYLNKQPEFYLRLYSLHYLYQPPFFFCFKAMVK